MAPKYLHVRRAGDSWLALWQSHPVVWPHPVALAVPHWASSSPSPTPSQNHAEALECALPPGSQHAVLVSAFRFNNIMSRIACSSPRLIPFLQREPLASRPLRPLPHSQLSWHVASSPLAPPFPSRPETTISHIMRNTRVPSSAVYIAAPPPPQKSERKLV